MELIGNLACGFGFLGPQEVPTMIMSDIEEDIEKSDLPYLVDVVDFCRVSERSQKIAGSVTIPL